jgi:CheY-like chemotaxis protein
VTRLTVRDSGQGIEADLLPHVFDPFRQAESPTKRGQAGLGLGLAIVRSLVELHGGTVTAHSDGAGRGATFTVTFPVLAVRTRPEPRAPAPPRAAGAAPTLDGRRVLVVDDNGDSRELVRAVLEAAGAEVTTAGSAAEALACLATAPIDIVVTDLGMPIADGYDLLRALRQLPAGPAIPVIALTAFASLQDRDRVVAAGFQGHVTKPADPDRLIEALAAALAPALPAPAGALTRRPGCG